jgi:predicted regulator of Ras-like GTPase activity (Roadblock/LC7/MglB family)
MQNFKNFSEALADIKALETVEGTLLADRDGLPLDSSFNDEVKTTEVASQMLALHINILKGLKQVGEVSYQTCMVSKDRLIILQGVGDVVLVVYAKKKNLAELQNRISFAIKGIQNILASYAGVA